MFINIDGESITPETIPFRSEQTVSEPRIVSSDCEGFLEDLITAEHIATRMRISKYAFCGDVVDHGPKWKECIEKVMKWKSEDTSMPLIIGNRDINKMRLPYEGVPLTPTPSRLPPPTQHSL
jgi:hypothetical protein